LQGLAFTFNSGPLEDIFSPKEVFEPFRQEILEMNKDNVEKMAKFKQNFSKIEMGTKIKELRFGLRHSYPDIMGNTHEPFKLAVHTTQDVAVNFIELYPGYR
jgi:hypothetical protein